MSAVRLDDNGDGFFTVLIDGGDEIGIIVDDETRTFRVVVWLSDGTAVNLAPASANAPVAFPFGPSKYDVSADDYRDQTSDSDQRPH